MKNELKISRLAIICVLCTAFSGAYGASSVRSLGGEGTYSSASSATAANSTSNTAVSRSGSVRVTPTISTSGSSTTATTGTSNSGRSTTTPRLSIGKYLGGATSVSGGSSLRPQTPSGGSSSGGEGSVDTGLVEDMINQAIDGLDAEIQDLWAEKQNVLYPSDGFVSIENDEIYLNVDNLKGALDIATGQDGREIEIERQGDYIVWRYVGETAWNNLISVADITGPQGPQGEKGEKGEPGDVAEVDLTGYATTEEMNDSIAVAVANLSSVYATVDALSGKANIEDVYTKDEVYNKTEVNEKVAEVAAGDMQEALKDYAKQDYVDQQLANKANALTSDALTETLEGYATTDALNSGLSSKLNVGALTGYATQTYVDSAVSDATEDFITTSEVDSKLANKADTSDLNGLLTSDELAGTLSGYATVDALSGKANIADVYTKDEVYNKAEVNDKVAEVAAGDMQEALKDYAKQDYVDQQLANKANALMH